MKINDKEYKKITQILCEELIPAMGCTEPIALALAAATAKKYLGELPQKIDVKASISIIKNVKSVVVPHTCNLRGIEAAVAVGAIAGNADKKLEVISEVSKSDSERIEEYIKNTPINVQSLESDLPLDVVVTVYANKSSVSVRIANSHTNIVHIEKNGEEILNIPAKCESDDGMHNHGILTGDVIWEYVNCADVTAPEIHNTIKKQIDCNTAIAREGLNGNYGANIGSTMLKSYPNDVYIRARAYAAAGSDARMNGCEMPVIINSGSGNQGITCCVPVTEYAKELKADEDKLYRALILSNLMAIHIKSGLGRLSAFCGAVSAAAGAGIAYLHGADKEAVFHTVVNALGIISGTICDGAKASCAAKIAASVDAGILGYNMYKNGNQFMCGEGIITKGFEANIRNIGRLGKYGMKETNTEILHMMLNE